MRSLSGDNGVDGPEPRVATAMPDPAPMSKFTLLPAELRLKIWSCAVEPRIIIHDDLVQKLRSYPLPPVTQLNFETRLDCGTRHGYEPFGRGSYFNFSRDILVCDTNISDVGPSKFVEEVAPRIQRLAFYDCFPDDESVERPHQYSDYLTIWYRNKDFGKVEFDQFLFPNLKDLWIVKVGDIDRAWKIGVDNSWPYEVRLRKTAAKFRYWIDENIIEIAPLDLDEPDTRAVLREGRCGKENCRELNRGRNKMVSRITFMDGKYRQLDDGTNWSRVQPWSKDPEGGRDIGIDSDTTESKNRMRWIMVERILTISLRWEGPDEPDTAVAARRHPQESLSEKDDEDKFGGRS